MNGSFGPCDNIWAAKLLDFAAYLLYAVFMFWNIVNTTWENCKILTIYQHKLGVTAFSLKVVDYWFLLIWQPAWKLFENPWGWNRSQCGPFYWLELLQTIPSNLPFGSVEASWHKIGGIPLGYRRNLRRWAFECYSWGFHFSGKLTGASIIQ